MVTLHVKYLNQTHQGYPYITFRDVDDQRIPKSDWIRAFWHITCTAEFSLIQGLHWETDTGKAFHFRLLPAERNSAETQENSILGSFSALFVHFRPNKNSCGKSTYSNFSSRWMHG